MLKRFGYLFDALGYDYYPRLKPKLDKNFIKLDYNLAAAGKKDSKWRIIINTTELEGFGYKMRHKR